MQTTPRMGWPYPSENQDPWYDALASFFEGADLSAYASRETENLILTSTATFSYTAGVVTWNADLEVLAPITGFSWVLAAANLSIADGQILWFDAIRSPSSNTTVLPVISSQLPLSDTAVILAVRRGTKIYWRNGAGLADGTPQQLSFGPAGAGATLTSSAPVDVDKGAAAVGVGTTAARHDHKHGVSTAIAGTLTVGAAAAEGSALSLARSDHVHAVTAPAAPADVTKSAAVAGAATTVARSDHKHDVSTAAAGSVAIGDAAAEGSATSLARSDHVHALAVPSAPVSVTKAAADAGVATTVARSDHKHDVSTAAPTTGVGTGNSEGVATTLARSDHNHTLRETGGPTDLTIASIPDGEFLKRVGATIVGGVVASPITVKDEGSTLTTAATSIDFVGASVVASNVGPAVTVTISASAGGVTYNTLGLNETTVQRITEVVLGGLFFDPANFGTPTVKLRLVGNYASIDAGGNAKVYLYDMGPGTGAFSPVRRAAATIPFASVGNEVKVDQALVLVGSPGVDANQIHNTARVYELRMYLNTTDVGSSMNVTWSGLEVTAA